MLSPLKLKPTLKNILPGDFTGEAQRERPGCRWHVPVRGPVTTNNFELMRSLVVSGVGLYDALEPTVADELARGQLCIVLEPYAPEVAGLFLYFPSRARVSPALKALVDVARELLNESNPAK